MTATSLAPRIVCLGGALADRKYRLKAPAIAGSSNPAEMRMSFGGVARNVAENLARLGASVALAVAVGRDDAGQEMLRELEALGVDLSLVRTMPDAPTSEYAAFLGATDGEVLIAAASMDAAERALDDGIDAILAALPEDATLFADANLSAPTLNKVIAACWGRRRPLALNAVSVTKAARLPAELDGVDLVIMNREEAVAFLDETGSAEDLARSLRRRGARRAIVTAGADGAAGAEAAGAFRILAPSTIVTDATGAGDSLIAATLWKLAAGAPLRDALRWGIAAATITVGDGGTVSRRMSPAFLTDAVSRMRPK